MKFNTRNWSTPLIIGIGLFTVMTGLVMMFYIEKPIKFTHEIAGLVFTLAISLHVISNIKSIKRYFSQFGATSIIVLVWIIGFSLIGASIYYDRGEIEYVIVEKLKTSTVERIAVMLDVTPGQLIDQLENNGVKVDNTKISISELAVRMNLNSDDLLEYIFR